MLPIAVHMLKLKETRPLPFPLSSPSVASVAASLSADPRGDVDYLWLKASVDNAWRLHRQLLDLATRFDVVVQLPTIHLRSDDKFKRCTFTSSLLLRFIAIRSIRAIQMWWTRPILLRCD